MTRTNHYRAHWIVPVIVPWKKLTPIAEAVLYQILPDPFRLWSVMPGERIRGAGR